MTGIWIGLISGIYFIGYVISIGVFYDEASKKNIFWQVIASLFWPAIAIGIVFGSFIVFLYKIGKCIRRFILE